MTDRSLSPAMRGPARDRGGEPDPAVHRPRLSLGRCTTGGRAVRLGVSGSATVKY